jgi:hypothetical protein
MVETPLKAGIAVGFAVIDSSEPVVAVSGTLSHRMSEAAATTAARSETA